METSCDFYDGFYIPANSNSDVDLIIQNQTWLVRKKIVSRSLPSSIRHRNGMYQGSFRPLLSNVIIELQRQDSAESVDVHLIIYAFRNNDLNDKKFTNKFAIAKNQYLKEITVFEDIEQEYTFIGMLSVSLIHSSKTNDNSKQSPRGFSSAISSQLSKDFANLLDSDVSSDFVLRCAGEEFRVHKCILAARSSVFAAMFRFHNKNTELQGSAITPSVTPNTKTFSCKKQEKFEDCTQETSDAPNLTEANAEDIEDLKPEILLNVLKYVYSGQIDDLTGDEAGDLLYAADKYQLSLLKEICVEKLKSTMSASNVLDMLVMGDLHDQSLKNSAMDFICKYPSLSELKKMDKWTSLQTTHPTMVIEVLTSVVGYLQDSKIKV